VAARLSARDIGAIAGAAKDAGDRRGVGAGAGSRSSATAAKQ